MSLVLDASVTLSWCFEDERTPASNAILHHVRKHGAAVPPIWQFEVANALQMGVRRQRIDAVFRDETLADLALLSVVTDGASAAQAWSVTVWLADRHGLAVYDAAYLELAQRRRLPLATLDGALVRAADAEFVEVMGA